MEEWLGMSLLYILGVTLVIVERVLPTFGLVGIVGLLTIIFGVYLTMRNNEPAGWVAIATVLIVLPAGLLWAVKNWHRSPIGRRISPPNPELTAADRMPEDHMAALIGQVGTTRSELRPVGMCEFNGQRIECVAEFGMIEPNVKVQGVRVVNRTLSVQPVKDAATNA